MDPLLAVLAGLGLLHAANGVVHRFEREAAVDLASRLEGPRKQVFIRSSVGPEAIFGEIEGVTITARQFQTDHLPLTVDPTKSKKGELRHLTIRLEDFELGALHVRSLVTEIPNCRFDYAAAVAHHTFRLTKSGEGEIQAEVSQDDLATFVKHKFPGLGRLKLTLDHDKITLEGHAVLLLAPADFWLVARIEPSNRSKLVLVDARLILNGMLVPPDRASQLVGLFNPVLDLDRDLALGGAVNLQRIELRDGVMRAFGAVVIPSEPSPQP